MQTNFSLTQLQDPDIAEVDKVLRACVHCGFCTATCPTYVLDGDERDSPRGRIYLMKEMLEQDRPATETDVLHIDRCLSCLSCMTTCPSGVNYMHLVDHGRVHIEKTYKRPLGDRLLRSGLAYLLARPRLFRLALMPAVLLRPLAYLLPKKLRHMALQAPVPKTPSPVDRPQIFPATGQRRKRVALMTGCVQQVIAPAINEATIRLLTRLGCEVVVAKGAGCCGALAHHLGKEAHAMPFIHANIDAWSREIAGDGLDAIVVNASGCGTTVKDYGFMLRDDPAYAEKARAVSERTRDISEVLAEIGLGAVSPTGNMRVAFHAACSLQHGQAVRGVGEALLAEAGFQVLTIPDGHLCCGSAGTYSLLQPDYADRLKARKVATIESVAPDCIAAGNIGCITQIGGGTAIPIVHTVQLLDWATGGPSPLP